MDLEQAGEKLLEAVLQQATCPMEEFDRWREKGAYWRGVVDALRGKVRGEEKVRKEKKL